MGPIEGLEVTRAIGTIGTRRCSTSWPAPGRSRCTGQQRSRPPTRGQRSIDAAHGILHTRVRRVDGRRGHDAGEPGW